MTNFRIWQFFFRRSGGSSTPPPVLPRTGFRDGDTFIPQRILAMEERLAVLHATTQALACCALTSRRERLQDSGAVSVRPTSP
jgi:hypothetical protein